MLKSKVIDRSGYALGVVPRCDSCEREILAGEQIITGVRSCCGACPRTICLACMRVAAEILASVDASAEVRA